MGGLDRDPEGGPESRLWAAVVERGQEPERLDQTKKPRPTENHYEGKDIRADSNASTRE